MAFRVDAVREAGGFPEQIGRKGSGSLLSNEELRIQDALRAKGLAVRYIRAAAVRHHVHEDRLRRNWMRARMAWQSVSEHLTEPVEFHREWITGELHKLAARNPDVGAMARLLLSPASGMALSEQLSTIHHLVALLLSAHTIDESEINALYHTLLEKAGTIPGVQAAPRRAEYLPVTEAYAPSSAGGARARYVFVEGTPGHQYLFDLYGDLPQSHLVTYPAKDAWNTDPASVAAFTQHLAFVYRSLSPATKAVFFLTLDQAIAGPQREEFMRFVAACPARVHGILHRLPQTPADMETVQRLSRLVENICFLSEAMAEQARSVLRLSNACYLPHHPTSFPYGCSPDRRSALRAGLGVAPDQIVFSVIGEARIGKGIDLLMSALPHIPSADRSKMFFLIAGKARHYKADKLRAELMASRTAGAVDLRESGDDLHYFVLSEREYADYVAISDAGLLLYQYDQRNCMSGVLGDYVWSGRPVIVTDSSYTGSEVQRHDLGLVLRSEEPEATAALLVEGMRLAQHYREPPQAARAYREQIAPEVVLRMLHELLEAESSGSARLNRIVAEIA